MTVNHEQFMREIEETQHGAMTAQERSDKIGKIVQNWKIEMEEEYVMPFADIPVKRLSPLNRKKTLAYVKVIHGQNLEGKRGKAMEMYCKGQRDACISIDAEIIVGKLE